MLDENLQTALKELDASVAKKKGYSRSVVVVLFALVVLGGVSVIGYEKAIPSITQDNFMRMIVISSRSGEIDPVRLLINVEQKMGKKADDFNRLDRANAVQYLLDRVEIQKRNTEQLVY